MPASFFISPRGASSNNCANATRIDAPCVCP
jgi:hypothetical protein